MLKNMREVKIGICSIQFDSIWGEIIFSETGLVRNSFDFMDFINCNWIDKRGQEVSTYLKKLYKSLLAIHSIRLLTWKSK